MKKTIVYCDLCKEEHHSCVNIDLQALDTLSGKLEMAKADVCYSCLKLLKDRIPVTVHGINNTTVRSNRIPKWRKDLLK